MMGMEPILAVVLIVAASFGSYVQGKRTAAGPAAQAAMETVQMLQVQVDLLVQQTKDKDDRIATLEGRVAVLGDLVTQRAEVEEVHNEVLEVRGVVERIAAKVGA